MRKLQLFAILALVFTAPVLAQTPEEKAPEDGSMPVLTYHGLVPGRSNLAEVKKALGEPKFAAFWYNYKMLYPSEGREGMVDTVHMDGNNDGSIIGDIEAASIPAGYETKDKIVAALGKPEFELRMATWSLLDYSSGGVRFSLDKDGKTNGVAYITHGYRRVAEGERALVDLSDKRQGPQPAPAQLPDLKGLQVGVSEVKLTPLEKDWIRPEINQIHDDLYARIAIFSQGDLKVAFIGNDLFGMMHDDIREIRDAAAAMGITQTIFGMSHNHAAGDTIGVYGYYPQKYIQHIKDQCALGLKAALDALQPVKEIRAANREMPMDGERVMGLIRNARNPGIIDPTINLLQAIGMDGKPVTTIINFACHTESLEAGERELSADFPGYMCAQMKLDGLGQPVFLNGALGGMVSGDNPERTHASAKETGLKFAAIVKDLAATAQSPATYEFTVDRRELQLPLSNIKFRLMFAGKEDRLMKGRVRTDMIYVKLGEAQFVTLPGELLPEVSYEILDHMQGYPRILVGLANDQLGYMIPPYDFRDGSYEESMSVGPVTAFQVRDMAIRMVGGPR